MRAREGVLAGFVSTAEVCGYPEMLEVVPIEGRLGVSRRSCVYAVFHARRR